MAKNLGKEFSKGIIAENPVLRLVLGTCPTLATTTSVESAIGMGLAASIVLICSNIVISALRKVIPDKVRIPAYIVIIASFVTVVQMAVKAFLPALDEQLGVFLPLIVVNCIILGRAEAFANKNPVLASAVDGVGDGDSVFDCQADRRAFRTRRKHESAVKNVVEALFAYRGVWDGFDVLSCAVFGESAGQPRSVRGVFRARAVRVFRVGNLRFSRLVSGQK